MKAKNQLYIAASFGVSNQVTLKHQLWLCYVGINRHLDHFSVLLNLGKSVLDKM